ncbi:fetuin-B [Syngnathoides biaculeatus]|uniref:fetuin-B n=1 Tax=Syngnathoides biaculeatus TaxID=300417 RepID=UPI002ADDDF67|nr:fetuin-B [Syngnathoides biaculeatus]
MMQTFMYKFFLQSVLLFIQILCLNGEGSALVPTELAPVPCNDKAVEKVSRLALTYINEDRAEGYKFALNRIANVHLHAQGPAGNVYYLDLDVLETKCHIGSPKPWKRCDVRPFMETQISGNCNTTILHTSEGYTYLYSYDCTLVPDPAEKLQQTCPACPILLPVDSPQAVLAVQVSLAYYKRLSTLGAGLGVKRITRAAEKTLPVKARFVEYTVQECPEGVTERGTCQQLTPASDTETAGFCTASVHGDLHAHPDVQVSCEMFKIQNVDVLRPLKPQGHDLPVQPHIPTLPPFHYPGKDQQPAHSDPTPLPDPQPAPFDPTHLPDPQPAPFDPTQTLPGPVHPSLNPPVSLSSSSSESAEDFFNRQSIDSSSEEIGGPLALRPPLDFHYKKHDRTKRQALPESSPSHKPTFLSDFPSGPSPFRSCPGPARYTTV